MQMDFSIDAFVILGAILLGAISPGPSFVLVARTAVAVSRRDALATALGMGVGGLIFAGTALLGLMVVLASVPWLYLAIKVAGACYLLYLALSLWNGANDSL
jgi:threonine/homoserine/homoserine lactone efflux protein